MNMVALRNSAILLLLPCAASAGEKAPIVLKHDGWVAALAFSPDGKTLASAGADNVVRLWEVGTWKPTGVLKGHTDCVCALTYYQQGDAIITGSFDRTMKLWNPRDLTATATKRHKGAVTAVLAPYDQLAIVAGELDGTVHLDLAPFYKHKSWVNGLAAHYEKNLFASASSDGTVHVDFGGVGQQRRSALFEGGAGEVRCVAFSPDGKLLAAGNRYHTVRVWDVASRKEVKTLSGHMSDVWSIAFSPDGKTLAAADTDWKKPSKIKLWDTTTWKERGSLEMPGEILSIAYSPKGDWLAAGSWDRTVRVFSIR